MKTVYEEIYGHPNPNKHVPGKTGVEMERQAEYERLKRAISHFKMLIEYPEWAKSMIVYVHPDVMPLANGLRALKDLTYEWCLAVKDGNVPTFDTLIERAGKRHNWDDYEYEGASEIVSHCKKMVFDNNEVKRLQNEFELACLRNRVLDLRRHDPSAFLVMDINPMDDIEWENFINNREQMRSMINGYRQYHQTVEYVKQHIKTQEGVLPSELF